MATLFCESIFLMKQDKPAWSSTEVYMHATKEKLKQMHM